MFVLKHHWIIHADYCFLSLTQSRWTCLSLNCEKYSDFHLPTLDAAVELRARGAEYEEFVELFLGCLDLKCKWFFFSKKAIKTHTKVYRERCMDWRMCCQSSLLSWRPDILTYICLVTQKNIDKMDLFYIVLNWKILLSIALGIYPFPIYFERNKLILLYFLARMNNLGIGKYFSTILENIWKYMEKCWISFLIRKAGYSSINSLSHPNPPFIFNTICYQLFNSCKQQPLFVLSCWT